LIDFFWFLKMQNERLSIILGTKGLLGGLGVFRRSNQLVINRNKLGQQKRFIGEDTGPKEGKRAQYAATLGNIAALANWGIPIAAIVSLNRDPERINLPMTTVLALYSMLFMRWSVAVYPRNYPLFTCHTVNSVAQSVQVCRCLIHSLTKKKEKTE